MFPVLMDPFWSVSEVTVQFNIFLSISPRFCVKKCILQVWLFSDFSFFNKKPIRFVIGVTIVTHLWLDVLCIFVGRTRIKLWQSKASSNVGKIVLFERSFDIYRLWNWFHQNSFYQLQNGDLQYIFKNMRIKSH